jgi:hypothetical protein
VLTVFALPVLASDPPGRGHLPLPEPSTKPPAVDTLVAIAEARLDGALDEKTPPDIRKELFAQALHGYEKALQQDPKSKVALRGLAQLHARTENRQRSIEVYRKYLALYPDAEVAHEVALAHSRWKDTNGAVAWCKYALKIDPKYAPASALLEKLEFAEVEIGLQPPVGSHGPIGAPTPAEDPQPLPLPQKNSDAVPPATPAVVTYKLRNIAATDAAQALVTFVSDKRLTARVVAEPVSNVVLVSAEPALQRQFAEILAKLDTDPQQIIARVTVVQVPREFIARAGFNVGADADAKSWALSPREAHMLTELLRGAKERGECDVLSRPMMQVSDGQTGHVRVGQERAVVTGFDIKTAGGTVSIEPKTEQVPTGVTLELTPSCAPDGKTVRIRADFRYTEETGQVKTPLAVVPGKDIATAQFVMIPTFTTHTVQATAELKFGHTLVLAAGPEGRNAGTGEGKAAGSDTQVETLVIVTPELVRRQEPQRPAAGWFVK